jgi:hypothetical protein
MRVVQYAHACARKSLVTPDDQAPHVPHYFVGAAPIAMTLTSFVQMISWQVFETIAFT